MGEYGTGAARGRYDEQLPQRHDAPVGDLKVENKPARVIDQGDGSAGQTRIVRVCTIRIAVGSMHINRHVYRHREAVPACKTPVGSDHGLDMVQRIVEAERETWDIDLEFRAFRCRRGDLRRGIEGREVARLQQMPTCANDRRTGRPIIEVATVAGHQIGGRRQPAPNIHGLWLVRPVHWPVLLLVPNQVQLSGQFDDIARGVRDVDENVVAGTMPAGSVDNGHVIAPQVITDALYLVPVGQIIGIMVHLGVARVEEGDPMMFLVAAQPCHGLLGRIRHAKSEGPRYRRSSPF